MKGVDTNVLARFLVRDDARQFRRAAEALAALAEAGEEVRIDPIVLCELVWVLRAGYGRGRGEVADALDALLEAESFSIDDREIVREATLRFRSGKGDFADYLLGLRNLRAGCDATLTFDRKLRPADGFAAP